MATYLVFGISAVVLFLSAVRVGTRTAAAEVTAPNAFTDTTVRLHAKDIDATCWVGSEDHARLTVATEVGIDGKIRYATATATSGGSDPLRACVEEHVRSWEFLTQDHAQTMALAIEVDRR